MKCTFLGTGYAVNTRKRQNTSLFLQNDDVDLLVDCNGVCVQRLLEAGFAFETLEHIYLTHHHCDHVSGLDSLVQQIWLKSCYYADTPRQAPLHIYGPSHALSVASSLIELLDPGHMTGLFPIEYHDINEDGGALSFGTTVFEYVPVDHGKTPCFGIKTTVNGRTFFYTSDTMPVPDIYRGLKDGDILVHECTSIDKDKSANHTTWSQLKHHAGDVADIDIYLVHLPDLDSDDKEEHAMKIAHEISSPRFHISRDGQSFQI